MSLHSACPCCATDSQASLCCSMVQLPDSVSLTVFGQGGCWEGVALTPGTAPLRMEFLTCYQAGNGQAPNRQSHRGFRPSTISGQHNACIWRLSLGCHIWPLLSSRVYRLQRSAREVCSFGSGV